MEPKQSLLTMLEFLLVWSCSGLIQVTTTDKSRCVHQPCHVQKAAFHNAPPHMLALISFIPTLPWCSLNLRYGENNINNLFIVEYLKSVLWPLWVSALIINWNKKFLWPRLGVALLYRYQNKYWEDSLTTVHLVTSLSLSPSRTYDLASHGLLCQY